RTRRLKPAPAVGAVYDRPRFRIPPRVVTGISRRARSALPFPTFTQPTAHLALRFVAICRSALMRFRLTLLLAILLLSLPAFAQIDPSGEWNPRFHEDNPERLAGPDIGDYLGLPISDAARLRGESWDASILTLPEHQCKPHPADYGPRG